MKTSRYREARILSILRQAEGGVPVAELCREHGMMPLNRPSFAGDQLVRVTRPYRVCSSLHRIPLQLRRVGCFRWVQAGGDG